MAEEENPMVTNRSMLKDFLTTIATMSGDLSNITAPPFVLDTKSTIEVPAYWAENPSIFCAPAHSSDPAERALLVLRSLVSGLKSQCYMGHSEEEGVKKPLNAFLGELFLGKWDDEKNGTTLLVSEQVSHHPPITACRVWNESAGVIAEGYNRQTITFNGNVNIQCAGYALKTLTKYNEHYLIPIPDFKVKGVLSGAPYPELGGTYYLPSTSGYCSVIHFSGKSFFSSSSKKHTFSASVFHEDEGEDQPIYTIEGHWNESFVIRDAATGKDIENFVVAEEMAKGSKLIVPPVEEQDPWETRNAWSGVIKGLKAGNMKAVTDAKSRLEQGQRDMRKDEEKEGKKWKPRFFELASTDVTASSRADSQTSVVASLLARIPSDDSRKQTKGLEMGAWNFDAESYKNSQRPFYPGLRPDNRAEGDRRSSLEPQQSPRSSPRQSSTSVNTAASTSTSRRGTPRQSIDGRASVRQSVDLPVRTSPRKSMDARSSRQSVDERVGAVEDGRSASVSSSKVDVGRQPEKKRARGITKNQPGPQTAQTDARAERRGSGIEGMSVNEKNAVEAMLRDQYRTSR